MPAADNWRRRDPGPVVRPYAVTGGRTESVDGQALDLIALIVATGRRVKDDENTVLTPEHRAILRLCERPITVADLASDTGLPVGVVRVLLADLMAQSAVSVVRRRAGQPAGNDVLQEILNGLRAL